MASPDNGLAAALMAPGGPALAPRNDEAERQALARMLMGPTAPPITLEQRLQNELGLSPTMERSFFLPVGREAGSDRTEWAWPGAASELAKALMLPGHAMQGGSYTPADVTNMAMSTMTGGLVGTRPSAALAAGAARRGGTGLGAGGLPMDEASRMARAREMGFYDQLPLYHGTKSDIREFDLSKAGRTSGDPAAQMGVFSALDPQVANRFAEMAFGTKDTGSNVLPLLHRAKKPVRVELVGGEKSHEVASTLGYLWDQGYDAAMIQNYTAGGALSPSNIIVVRDPNQLRSRFAAFDPAKIDSADLLAANRMPVLTPDGQTVYPQSDEQFSPLLRALIDRGDVI